MNGRLDNYSQFTACHHRRNDASLGPRSVPRTNPKSPQDVLATLYRHLQIDTDKQYVNAAGRPISVLPSGAPINELF